MCAALKPAPDGARGGSAGADGRPASRLSLFHDIAVVPTQAIRKRVPRGGPIWPRFYRQHGLRHCRSGRPVDVRPEAPEGALPRIEEPCVWGGYLDLSFGHLVAEHLPRLPFALAERPGDIYLFTLPIGCTEDALPGHIWELLAWHGLPRAQVRTVTRPLIAATLRAGAQAEALWRVTPGEDYLALLDSVAAGNALTPEPAEVLYVSRQGFAAAGLGGHLGEGYLIGLLRRLGVSVLDPARASIRAQLAAYAGARHIVFAEGSALHGRQLLGRRAQDIHVLRRRPGSVFGRMMIAARCDRLVYHDTAAGALTPRGKNGAPQPHKAAALYDRAQLFAAFAEVGIDLAATWDEAAYRAEAEADAARWIAGRPPARRNDPEIAETLAEAGLVLPQAARPDTTGQGPVQT